MKTKYFFAIMILSFVYAAATAADAVAENAYKQISCSATVQVQQALTTE